MENEKLPIKFFAPREVDELRVEGAGNSEEPKWVLQDDDLGHRSVELITAFNQVSDVFADRIKRQSLVPYS